MPSTIVLHLARNPGAPHPEGDEGRGYAITAPLDEMGQLDLAAFKSRSGEWEVRRFGPDMPNAIGCLIQHGSHWRIHYPDAEGGPDETVFRLGDHRFLPGDYVTITEPDGEALTY